MIRGYWMIVFLIGFALAACNNTDVENENVATDFYADYKIWGEEGKETVTVLLQYRLGGSDGKTTVLPEGVTIDGIPLPADSAGISGAYYEAAFPSATFEGDHIIEFITPDGKKHSQAFGYAVFAFVDEPPATLTMEPVTFELSGLPDSAKLHLLITDTAFATNDLNTEVEIIKGAFTITKQMWQGLKPGPMVLEIYREEKKPLYGFSKAGGILTTHYGLKREFIALPKASPK